VHSATSHGIVACGAIAGQLASIIVGILKHAKSSSGNEQPDCSAYAPFVQVSDLNPMLCGPQVL
jgi:hypothetical protein